MKTARDMLLFSLMCAVTCVTSIGSRMVIAESGQEDRGLVRLNVTLCDDTTPTARELLKKCSHRTAYDLVILQDGTVLFNGRADTAVAGERKGKVTAKDMAQIMDLAEQYDFFHLQDWPQGDEGNCFLCSRVTLAMRNRDGKEHKASMWIDTDRIALGVCLLDIRELINEINDRANVYQWVCPIPSDGHCFRF